MAATGEEVPGSRGGTNETLRRRYLIGNAADEEEVFNWIVANVPSSIADVPFTGFTFEEKEELDGWYDVEVNYGTGTKDQPEEDQVDYRFSFAAQGFHAYQSLATIASYKAGGGTPPDFGGAINVVNDTNGLRVEGFQIQPPPETFSLVYYPANATVSSAFQLQLEALCGLVNSTTYKGRPAGSLMLVRASGGARNNAGWAIETGWGYVANRTSIPVGDDITVASKDGFDLLWPYYEDEVDGSDLIKVPTAAYVERVLYRGDMNLLGI